MKVIPSGTIAMDVQKQSMCIRDFIGPFLGLEVFDLRIGQHEMLVHFEYTNFYTNN